MSKLKLDYSSGKGRVTKLTVTLQVKYSDIEYSMIKDHNLTSCYQLITTVYGKDEYQHRTLRGTVTRGTDDKLFDMIPTIVPGSKNPPKTQKIKIEQTVPSYFLNEDKGAQDEIYVIVKARNLMTRTPGSAKSNVIKDYF